jgi:hypothetical protein
MNFFNQKSAKGNDYTDYELTLKSLNFFELGLKEVHVRAKRFHTF